MHPLAAVGSASSGGLWAYVAIFALVAVGWAGVPAIGQCPTAWRREVRKSVTGLRRISAGADPVPRVSG